MPPVLVWLEQHAGRTAPGGAGANADAAAVDEDAAGRLPSVCLFVGVCIQWRVKIQLR